MEATTEKIKVMDFIKNDGVGITYKKYVPVLEKIANVKELVGNALYMKEDLKFINYTVLDINKFVCLISLYTNLQLRADGRKVFEDYDILMELGHLDIILSKIPVKEKEEIDKLFDNEIKTILEEQSVSSIINTHLNNFEKLITVLASTSASGLQDAVNAKRLN